MTKNLEREIEEAVLNHPEILGFPQAKAIRNVRVGWAFGRVDIMLLPASSETKLVLIEAKQARAADASSKVIGQLLMYYAGALDIGSVGLERLHEYAASHREKALSPTWISPKELTGGVSPPAAAWEVIQSGEKLRPEDVELFIALNDAPHEALRIAIESLHEHHGLKIALIVVQDGKPKLLSDHAWQADKSPNGTEGSELR